MNGAAVGATASVTLGVVDSIVAAHAGEGNQWRATAATLARVPIDRVRGFIIGAPVLLCVALLGGCSNPFLTSYAGVRCPPVNTAHVSVAAPTDATLIGTSDFVAEIVPGNTEAIQAAERVGADIVQWDRAFLRQDVSLMRESLAGDGLAPTDAGDLAVDQQGVWYRVHARFWRSNARGGIPPAASQAPPEAPASPPPSSPPPPSGSPDVNAS